MVSPLPKMVLNDLQASLSAVKRVVMAKVTKQHFFLGTGIFLDGNSGYVTFPFPFLSTWFYYFPVLSNIKPGKI